MREGMKGMRRTFPRKYSRSFPTVPTFPKGINGNKKKDEKGIKTKSINKKESNI